MAFTVSKLSEAMVCPAEPTPLGTLELSTIDRLPGMVTRVRTFHVFGPPDGHPAKTIKEALAKALVYYYPLAGRLAISSQGELQINCTADGVLFVEATADCGLDAVNYMSHPLVPGYDRLLPAPIPELNPSDVLVLMQVTQFACGGFVIGLMKSHCIADGMGSAKFMNCLGEFAQGLKSPTVEPIWRSDAIPKPPPGFMTSLCTPLKTIPPIQRSTYKLEQATIDVSLHAIADFKTRFFQQTGDRCSAFDILVAKIWQCRIRAINVNVDVDVELLFLANVRHLVRPPIPEGFYGNCFFPLRATASSGALVHASGMEVVKLIREAKARLPVEYGKWVAGEGEDPYVFSTAYTTLSVSDWSRLGFHTVDFGWGTPIQIVPVTYSDLFPVCIITQMPVPMEGARLITQCVEEAHFMGFKEQVDKMSFED